MKLFWDLVAETLGEGFAEDESLHETIHALSTAFTHERDSLPRDYLDDPEIQAAYLAYFVPLNFNKALMLLSSHGGLWPSTLDTSRPLRWVDFGAGPGTAMLAALAALKDRYRKAEKFPPIHIDLVDRQAGALNMADLLVSRFAELLKLDVTVSLHEKLPAAPRAADGPKYDLAIAANVLNELPPESGPKAREELLQLWDATSGVLFVLEPGHRVSSQRLIRFRERLLKTDPQLVRILGPCPHGGHCPLHRTQHWCHFSEPVTDGRMIDLNLRVFKNPREWLKFSYLLVRRQEPLPREENRYRAIGDLHMRGQKGLAIDLCQPDEKFQFHLPSNIPADLKAGLVRGATVFIDEDRNVVARPMTKRDPAKAQGPRGRSPRKQLKPKPVKPVKR